MPSPPGLKPRAPGGCDVLPVQDLRFTHDTIRPLFRSGIHCGRPLYTLVNDLCSDFDITLGLLPALEVVWHQGAWRCLSNRRLWCLKAFMGLSGMSHVTARVQILPHLPSNFAAKNSSCNNGQSVQIEGDEETLQNHLHSARRTCRHFFGPRGCKKGSSCCFSHDWDLYDQEDVAGTADQDVVQRGELAWQATQHQHTEEVLEHIPTTKGLATSFGEGALDTEVGKGPAIDQTDASNTSLSSVKSASMWLDAATTSAKQEKLKCDSPNSCLDLVASPSHGAPQETFNEFTLAQSANLQSCAPAVRPNAEIPECMATAQQEMVKEHLRSPSLSFTTAGITPKDQKHVNNANLKTKDTLRSINLQPCAPALSLNANITESTEITQQEMLNEHPQSPSLRSSIAGCKPTDQMNTNNVNLNKKTPALQDYEKSLLCWEFIRTGTCPRGELCRWIHDRQQPSPSQAQEQIVSSLVPDAFPSPSPSSNTAGFKPTDLTNSVDVKRNTDAKRKRGSMMSRVYAALG